MKALFLSASVGVGHLSAANALGGALREVDPAAQTPVVDSYEYAALVVSRIVSDGYLRMVKTIPQMYRYIYNRAERATEVGPFRAWAHQFTAGNLRPLLRRERPDVVVCTHAFPCGAMAEYKRAYADAPPVVGVVTDFAVHGFWIHENIDRYIVANEAMESALLRRHVRPENITVCGIPVRPEFAPSSEPRDALRERLNIPKDRYVVLLMGGGLGIAPLERLLDALKTMTIPLAAVVIAGRNARIERRLSSAAESVSYPVRGLPFVDNVFDYMHAADVLVTKPGGLTSAEALVAQVPMVLCKPLPGQEERNARVLVEGGAALRTRRLSELPAAVEAVLTDRSRRESMVAAALRLGRPHAAGDAAAAIARLIRLPKEIPGMNLPSSRTYAGWLAIVRILTGAIWLIHGIPKFLHSDKFAPPNGFIVSYVQSGVAKTSGPYHDFLVNVVSPHIGLFAELVRLGEVCAGFSLFLGVLTRVGALLGIALPLNYMAARGALSTLSGWGTLDAALLLLSAISLVLPTGRTAGIDALFARRAKRKAPVIAEFVPEPPLDRPTAPR